MAATSSTDTPRIFPILLVNFIGTLGYSLLLPFLVILVTKFKGDEVVYGVLGATYSLFQFVGAPILGKWSDRVGRRRVLLLSQGGTFLAWILFLVALLLPIRDIAQVGTAILTLPLIVLFLARALDGITGGNVSVANAYLADISTDATRQKNFGQMGAAAHLGFIAGPILAGLLGATAWEEILPVIGAMVISFTAILVIAFRLPESNPNAIKKPAPSQNINKSHGQDHKDCHKLEGESRLSTRRILALPNVGFVLLFYFLIILAFNFFYVSFPMMAVRGFAWSTFELGIFFSIYGGILVLTEGPLLSRLSKRYSEGQLVPVGLVLLAAAFALLATGKVLTVAIGAGILATGNSIAWPSFLSFLSKVAGAKYQGAVQGQASSMGSLAAIIGLVIGGIVYANLGPYTFLIPSSLMVILIVLSVRLRRVDRDLNTARG
ncbi:MAG: MFS transporter [Bacteroidota bacterium]